jgi:CHAD domain-containing protein
MPYKLVLGESVAEGMRRIAIEQIEAALQELQLSENSPTIAVHRFRRRCKKIRAVIRLFRSELESDGTFHRENGALRDTARALAHVRDADVMMKTYDKLMDLYAADVHRPGFAPFRKALTMERRQLDDRFDESLPRLVEQARLAMVRIRQRAETWAIKSDGFAAIEMGLRKTYGRAWGRRRDAMATPTADALHEWRKRVKYHRNHLRLVSGIWPQILVPRSEEAEVLAELLGDDHDLAVLREKLIRDHSRFGNLRSRRDFIALIDRGRDAMFADITTRGARLFAEKPDQFVRSVRKWWNIWEDGATRLLPSPGQVATNGRAAPALPE